MVRKELEGLSREELVARAEALGVVRPRALTIPELIDEIVQADAKRPGDKRQRGWFGKARDLLTSVIDRGLNVPEPRSRRADGRPAPPAPPPLPTVTLAEIYAAQGHLDRAIATLDEVLVREPGHTAAASLRARFSQQLHKTKPSVPPPVIEAQLEPMAVSPDAASHSAAAPVIPPPAPVPAVAGPSTPAEAPVATEPSTPAAAAEVPVVTPPRPATRPPPATFEIDEIVGLAVDPHTVYLYWEVRPSTLASARAAQPDGSLVIRAVTVRASLSGPATEARDFRVDALFGELFVRGLAPQSNVRVSVGYKSAGGFEPFAVGFDITTPRAAPAGEKATTFRRWSEAKMAQPTPSRQPMQPPMAQRTRAFQDYASEGSEALMVKFPAGVWVDPEESVVRVVTAETEGTEEGGFTRREVTTRYGGASDLTRQEKVWSSDAVRKAWSSRVAARP